MNRTKAVALLVGLAISLTGWAPPANAHCEIPCGIYTDEMRIEMIKEHIQTIEKSMKQIVELSAANPVNYNQVVRWVSNKEEHATKIQHIVTQYFMTQRVKPESSKDRGAHKAYLTKLTFLHEMLFQAMRAKQSTDLKHVEKLRELTAGFHEAYFGVAEKKHLEEHHE
ncbi:MAG: superoxide dismutase [Candidatus Latescibacterota bacterium]|nr:MAG: superoxide dismutase [Candidatus Latescibacterota bacterium]